LGADLLDVRGCDLEVVPFHESGDAAVGFLRRWDEDRSDGIINMKEGLIVDNFDMV
jgi:hypothetical protein